MDTSQIESPSSAGSQPHSGFGIASCVTGAVAFILFASSLHTMYRVVAILPSTQSVALVQGLRSLASFGGIALAIPLLVAGLVLGIVGLSQPGRRLLFSILGTTVNSSLLLTMGFLTLIIFGAMRATQVRQAAMLEQARKLETAATAIEPRVEKNPILPAFAAEIERRRTEAAGAGYENVVVADLVADPARYSSRKVAVAGFYSGTSLEPFEIYGAWAKGGVVWANGSTLPADVKKTLLVNLDGFHKVFVRGMFRPVSSPRTKKRLSKTKDPFQPLFYQSSNTPPQIVADEIVDLGRVENPSLEP